MPEPEPRLCPACGRPMVLHSEAAKIACRHAQPDRPEYLPAGDQPTLDGIEEGAA